MKVIRGLLAAVVVLVIGAVVLVLALPGEKIAKLAADQIKAQTGRDLTLEGGVGFSWYPVLGVSTGPLTFANADWSEAGPMFSAQQAVIGVELVPALRGELRIKKIELVAPEVVLERAKDGRVNWDLSRANASSMPPTGTPTSAADQASPLSGFSLEHFSMRDAALRFVDHAANTEFEVVDLGAEMAWPGAGQAAKIEVTLRPAQQTITAEIELASVETLLAGGISDVVLDVQAAKGHVRFDGRAGMAPEVAGKLAVDLPDAAAFAAALGVAGGIAGPVKMSGDVTFTKAQLLSLRAGSVEALGNALTVQADVALGGERPRVTAQIATDHLKLKTAATGDTGGGQSAPVTAGWSKAAIDASALSLVDGTVSFAAEAMDLGNIRVGRTRATIEIDRSRAVATLQEMAAFEGAVQGTLVANNRGGLSVRGDLTVAHIALQPFLTATAGLSRFTGVADMSTQFLSSGNSVHELMNALSGAGALSVGRGTIEGMDLDKLLRGGATGGTTVFNNMNASWTIQNGVLTNDDLLMELSRLVATGAGAVGLGTQTIDYVFSPQLRGADGPNVIVPVNISGPWADPKIAPDLDQLLKLNLDKERKQLEAEAVKAVEEELGLKKEDGQSTEDALKDRLEEEATKGLLKLFGGN